MTNIWTKTTKTNFNAPNFWVTCLMRLKRKLNNDPFSLRRPLSDEGWLRVNATTMILEQVDRIYIGIYVSHILMTDSGALKSQMIGFVLVGISFFSIMRYWTKLSLLPIDLYFTYFLRFFFFITWDIHRYKKQIGRFVSNLFRNLNIFLWNLFQTLSSVCTDQMTNDWSSK